MVLYPKKMSRKRAIIELGAKKTLNKSKLEAALFIKRNKLYNCIFVLSICLNLYFLFY